MVAGAVGRIATVRGLLEYFHKDVASNVSMTRPLPFAALFRLNFLRAAVAVSAVFGIFGAAILAGFASPDADPQPGLAWSSLNWLLSLAGMFAVRDGENAAGAISAAVGFCRECMGAIFAVSA